MRTPLEVLVVGAGVSGLTTAICLAEAGYAVQVRARDLSERTTSYSAGAIWDRIWWPTNACCRGAG